MSFQIAIDGPAGAGKSTIAKRVAAERNLIYVDTGAMYRAVAVYLLRENVNLDDPDEIASRAADIDITLRYEDGAQHVFLNGEDVTSRLRTEEVGNAASKSSPVPAIRARLLQLQKNLANSSDCVMDGRDIGTVVLPDAQLKIFLTADPEVRAKRRFDELTAKGESPDFDHILADIKKRDEQDMTRAVSPLKQAEDAVPVDTSCMTIDEVVSRICELVDERK